MQAVVVRSGFLGAKSKDFVECFTELISEIGGVPDSSSFASLRTSRKTRHMKIVVVEVSGYLNWVI